MHDAIVIDANVAIDLAARDLLDGLASRLVAPALMQYETRSVLHREGQREGVLDYALTLQLRIERAAIRTLDAGAESSDGAWQIADELGWQKTYDAEYLALARGHGLPIASYDARLASAARRLGIEVATLP